MKPKTWDGDICVDVLENLEFPDSPGPTAVAHSSLLKAGIYALFDLCLLQDIQTAMEMINKNGWD